MLLATVILSSCSGAKPLSRDKLRSDLLSAISLSSETDLFIDRMRDGRAPFSFAKAHIHYLRQEASRLAYKLSQTTSEPKIAAQYAACRNGLNDLNIVLRDLDETENSENRLWNAQQKVATIKKLLEEAKAAL